MSILATPSVPAPLSLPPTAAAPPARQRVVLDTNVCLDLFVFRDPRWAALLQALEDGSVEAYTREDCRSEWLAVLEYPHLPVTAENKPAICADFDRLLRCLPLAEVNTFGLPLCTDRDDQKFLEIARDADAEVLVTKDKALLKLARKTAQAGMFRILTPEAWVKALCGPSAAASSAR